MNERILELAIEARKYAESKPDIYQVAYDKKFAELIVKECAEVLDTWNKENGAEEGLDKQGLISLWSPHFGVEE